MGLYNKLLIWVKDSNCLFVVLGFLASSCIGSVAATMSLIKLSGVFELIQLCIAMCTTAWFNVTILAKFSHKAMLNTLLLSVGANSLIIISHLFQG